MKKLITMLLLTFATSIFAVGHISPIGKWAQYSDKTGKLHSIIRVYRHEGLLEGKIIKAYPLPGEPNLCIKCSGKLKNHPIKSLIIMHGFKQTDSNVWGDGKILDPLSGHVYKCKLTLLNHGNTMKVRGYFGIPLFGRTQVWQREK